MLATLRLLLRVRARHFIRDKGAGMHTEMLCLGWSPLPKAESVLDSQAGGSDLITTGVRLNI